MIVFPDIDPIAFSFGPISVYWYGIAYTFGILLGLYYAKKLSKNYSLEITPKMLDDYLLYLVIGVIVGGRLGYVFMYDPIKYLMNPLEILQIRNGGMSFHGGLIGVGLVSYIFSIRYKISFLSLVDIVSIVTPIGIFFGRIANFINGELYGRITDLPWAIQFPMDIYHGRHPSQIY